MTARSRTLLLAALTGLLVACGTATGAPVSQTPQPTETARPSVTPSPTPSVAPSETPVASPSSPETANPPIPADAVVASRVDHLRIRATPALNGQSLGTIAINSQSLVVDGPELADGLEWYRIAGLGIPFGSGCVTGPEPTNPWTCPMWLGWAARAAADGTPFLEEVEPQCADPASLDNFVMLSRYEYIACYGDAPLTLRGYLFQQPSVFTGGDPCPQVPDELRWLGCVDHVLQLASGPNRLGVVLTLGLGAGLPGDGGEIVVEGHFDHPAAAECTYGDEPGRAELDCRAQFVVTSAGGTVDQ